MNSIKDFLLTYFVSPKVDQQNIFYLFSTSAQTTAAFIAFIIAGYALVYQAMDNIESKDESKVEVHHQLKVEYHSKIFNIGWLTGTTLLLCFIVLWINGFQDLVVKPYLITVTFIMILITIFQAIRFVIQMIDPDKLKKAAKQILEEDFKKTLETIDENQFASKFIELERRTMDIFYKNQNYLFPIKTKNARRDYVSLREVVETFYRNEFLYHEEYERFMEIIKYRNLVFHGRLDKVDKSKVIETEKMIEIVDQIEERIKGRFAEE